MTPLLWKVVLLSLLYNRPFASNTVYYYYISSGSLWLLRHLVALEYITSN